MTYEVDYYGFVYKWTNTRNKKYYIGSHHGPLDDGYIGSGVWFSRAYNKEPEVFERVILEFNTDDDYLKTLDLENEFLETVCEVGNKDKCYNISRSAGGGWQLHGKTEAEIKEIYAKISKSIINRTDEDRTKSLEKYRETIKTSENVINGRLKSKETKKNWSPERKQLMADRMRKTLAENPEIQINAVKKRSETWKNKPEEEKHKITKKRVALMTPESIQAAVEKAINTKRSRSEEEEKIVRDNLRSGQKNMDPKTKEEKINKFVDSFKNRPQDEKEKSEKARLEKWLAKKEETARKISETKRNKNNAISSQTGGRITS
jgi:hypothetical protein